MTSPLVEDYRLVCCAGCDGEGRLYFGHPEWSLEPCPYCEGTGGELLACEPLDETDAEHIDREIAIFERSQHAPTA